MCITYLSPKYDCPQKGSGHTIFTDILKWDKGDVSVKLLSSAIFWPRNENLLAADWEIFNRLAISTVVISSSQYFSCFVVNLVDEWLTISGITNPLPPVLILDASFFCNHDPVASAFIISVDALISYPIQISW